MKLPFKSALLNIRRGSVKWIIIHHTVEMYPAPESRIDNSKFQIPGIINGVLEKSDPDINYHYIIDKIKDDYIPIVCRPITSLCIWDDIPDDINKRALHISILGDYNFKVAEKRLYEILAYRLLSPMLKLFHLSPSKIKLHNEVSSDNITCPGDFIDKGIIISMVKRFMIR